MFIGQKRGLGLLLGVGGGKEEEIPPMKTEEGQPVRWMVHF